MKYNMMIVSYHTDIVFRVTIPCKKTADLKAVAFNSTAIFLHCVLPLLCCCISVLFPTVALVSSLYEYLY